MAGEEKQAERMAAYHKYLNENYVGGSERFFSPTGFLDSFQRSVEIGVSNVRKHVFVRTIDEAVAQLEPVVAGQEGVFDLTAEPGTGKTSVLPFRFSSKKVVVALPTPFEAFSAYQMATGSARLRLKGLTLGPLGANVVYTDSYLAAKALMSNYLEYDILIVDECDSSKGVTRFLSEVRAPGKLLIRMSASHGRTKSGPSKSFQVTDCDDMPDVRVDPQGLAAYVGSKHKGRSLVMTPDADTAQTLHQMLPSSRLVSSRSNLSDIARAVVNQEGDRLYISDDVCARGLNLNLDCMFDCQLVAEHGVVRGISEGEFYQRKNRVGRNRAGWYHSPGLERVQIRDADMDIFRCNVVRSVGNVPQEGGQRLEMSEPEANLLLCSDIEPFVKVVELRFKQRSESPEFKVGSPESVGGRSDSSSERRRAALVTGKAKTPGWMFHFGAASSVGGSIRPADAYVITHKGRLAFVRRSSQSSSSSGGSKALTLGTQDTGRPTVSSSHTYSKTRALLPMAETAPYAVFDDRLVSRNYDMALPMSPPVMDLNELTYDMDWPRLIRDRLVSGGDLPTLVPPGSWRHTSTGGIGNDWLRRLDDMAFGDNQFDEPEFEVVCRAWNKLVALVWVKQTPGLSSYSNKDRIEYCARYFQSYFLLAAAD